MLTGVDGPQCYSRDRVAADAFTLSALPLSSPWHDERWPRRATIFLSIELCHFLRTPLSSSRQESIHQRAYTALGILNSYLHQHQSPSQVSLFERHRFPLSGPSLHYLLVHLILTNQRLSISGAYIAMSEVARAGPPTRVLYPTSSPNLDQSSNSHAFTHGGDAQKENSLPRGTQSAQNVMLGSPSKLRGSPNPNLLATPGARWEHGHLQNEQPADDNDAKGSWRSWKRGEGLQPWEIEIANSPEVRRKANVAQLCEHLLFPCVSGTAQLLLLGCAWRKGGQLIPLRFEFTDFLNHYFDSLRYLADRKARLAAFQSSTAARGLYLNGSSSSSASDSLPETPEEAASAKAYAVERASYLGRERAFLRKRRTALRLAQFHIITQIGQGGYGAVYLARKRETGEVCALKRLKKKVLVNMNEVSSDSAQSAG